MLVRLGISGRVPCCTLLLLLCQLLLLGVGREAVRLGQWLRLGYGDGLGVRLLGSFFSFCVQNFEDARIVQDFSALLNWHVLRLQFLDELKLLLLESMF